MNNKNIIILFSVLLIIVLGYYGFSNKKVEPLEEIVQTETVNISEDYFARNQDCLKYKNEITKKLEAKDSPFGETSLEQIFYSPIEKSCLYLEYSEKDGFYNRRLLDILNDGYNSTPLEMCSSIEPLQQEVMNTYNDLDGNLDNYYKDLKACDNFDDILKKYK